MSNNETSLPKPSHSSSSWNVLRSRSVPSGVSGSHPVAKLAASDESLLNQEEKQPSRTRKVMRAFQTLDPALLKH